MCNWCNSFVSIDRVRITSKAQCKYKCHRCQSTMSKISQTEGKWPTTEFLALSESEQATFYQQAAQEKNASKIVKMVHDAIEKYRVRENQWELGGQFLPIGVWVAKGWNRELIEKNTDPSDIIYTPQGGYCYRVKILATSERGIEGSRQSVSYGSEERHGPPQLALSAAGSGAPAIESRSEYLERTKREKEARKEQDKTASAKRALAVQLAKKLSGPLDGLSRALKTSCIQSLNKDLVRASVDVEKAAADELAKLNSFIDAPDDNYSPQSRKEASICAALGWP